MPLPLVLGELLPGLPDQSVAASVEAIELADAGVAEWLRHPEKLILDESQWPEQMPRAKVHVDSQGEWIAICRHLVQLGICAPCTAG